MMATIKDPMYQLSGIFLLVMQIMAALMGGLFLFLGILAFSGSEFLNTLLVWLGENNAVSFEEMMFAGFVLLGLFLGCMLVFGVLQYLKKVVKKEIQ